MASSTKNFLLDLLGAAGHAGLPVSALLRACAAMGMRANAARVSLSRLKAQSWVQCDARGRYCLGELMPGLSPELSKWRDISAHTQSWDGTWLAVHLDPLKGSERERAKLRARALRLLGFREWRPGLALRPNNLHGSVSTVRERLAKAGLAASQPVFHVSELDSSPATIASLWEPKSLAAHYTRTCAALAQAAKSLPGLSLERAAADAFLLGNKVLKELAFDPLLPGELIDVELRERCATAMSSHDARARGYWSALLEVELLAQPCGNSRDGTDTRAPALHQFTALL